jgi:hypothetical protein
MTTMSTLSDTTSTSRLRAGLALSAVLGLMNIALILVPAPAGEDTATARHPGQCSDRLVSVVCAGVAWRSGNRLAIRINAAALIINALLSLPAFFVNIDAWIKVVSALSVILTVVALVLTLRREHTPFTVTD